MHLAQMGLKFTLLPQPSECQDYLQVCTTMPGSALGVNVLTGKSVLQDGSLAKSDTWGQG